MAGLSDDDGPVTLHSDPDASYDLLDGLSEDEGTPWMPDDDEDPSPGGIQGRVTYRGEIPSDYGPDPIPIVELKAGDGTVWSVRGYRTVLRNQIEKADPQVGDWAAFKCFGAKRSKAGREYTNYKVLVKKA